MGNSVFTALSPLNSTAMTVIIQCTFSSMCFGAPVRRLAHGPINIADSPFSALIITTTVVQFVESATVWCLWTMRTYTLAWAVFH